MACDWPPGEAADGIIVRSAPSLGSAPEPLNVHRRYGVPQQG